MAKTNFVDGNPAEQIEGTIVTAAFLNALNRVTQMAGSPAAISYRDTV